MYNRIDYSDNFGNGVSVRGKAVPATPAGRVFYVNNSAVLAEGGIGGSDSNDGSYLMPCKTIMGAHALCKAGRGDMIMCMPGHAETISTATGFNITKDCVQIIGMGQGLAAATLTIGTATTSKININANYVRMVNIVVRAAFAAVATAVSVGASAAAAGFILDSCTFMDNASNLNFAAIVTTNATANRADGMQMVNCAFYGLGATSGTAVFKLGAAINAFTCVDNYFAHKATSGAGWLTAGSAVVTNMICRRNVMNFVGAQALTTGIIMTTTATTNTGVIAENFISSLDDTSEILVTANSGFMFFNNYYTSATDKSGYLLPAADA